MKNPKYVSKFKCQLSNDQQFRLNKINEIKDYFIAEIRERELMSKNLSKYIASFDNLGKPLIVLSVATGSIFISIIFSSYQSTHRNYECKLKSCIFNYYRICKQVFKNNKKLEENHDKIVMLARSKLNSIESKISEALINN